MFIIVILSLIPVIIWAFMSPLGLRFLDLNSIATSMGQILGLVGTTLFSINLILAGRFKFLDKYFKGLDKVYTYHSNIGLIAFSLLLFHPLFLVVNYLAVSTKEAALFFTPFINMPITWGIISLALMILLISLTIYAKIKYQNWKLSHKFMTVVFFFAILHTLVIPSDISRNNLLRYYILSLALVGLIVSVRQTFLHRVLVKKSEYKIKNINRQSNDIVEIEMEAVNEKIHFTSGQFAFFTFLSEGITSESHPFSISSGSNENNLKITVKNLGDYTGLLKDLRLNDGVLVDGPYGNFSYKKTQNKNQIWIAGGIGITPFISMAKSLEDNFKIDLYYSVKEFREAVYLKELQEISRRNPNFKFILWITKDRGYIKGESVSKLSNGLDSKNIFLCGPPSFMESLKNQFVSLGVGIKKIHYENFSL
jgi:predicted ferric reductase